MQIDIANESLDLENNNAVPITFQANDPTKVDTFQSNYSVTISVLDNPKNRRLLGFVSMPQIKSTTAYTLVDCVVKDKGLVISPKGKLRVVKVSKNKFGFGTIEIQLFSGIVNLFDAIGAKTLQDLNMSAYDHEMIAGQDLQNMDWANGYTYDLYDRGAYLNPLGGLYSLWTPSVFALAILHQIVIDAGLTLDFPDGVPTNPVDLEKMLIPHTQPIRPCINEMARRHSGVVSSAFTRYLSGVSTTTSLPFIYFQNSRQPGETLWQAFNTPDVDFTIQPINPEGAIDYPNATFEYICNEDELFVLIDVLLDSTIPGDAQLNSYDFTNFEIVGITFIDINSIKLTLDIPYSNPVGSIISISGITGAWDYLNSDAIYNSDFCYTVDSITGNDIIITKIGFAFSNAGAYGGGGLIESNILRNYVFPIDAQSKFFLRMYQNEVWRMPAVATIDATIPQRNSFWRVTVVDIEAVRINLWEVAPNLAPIAQKEFFKGICIFYGLFPTFNPYTNQIQLLPFDKVLDFTRAVDWTAKLDYSKERDTFFTFGDFAQNNYMGWKNVAKQGNLLFESEGAEKEKQIYTSPLSLILDSAFFGDFVSILTLQMFEDSTPTETNVALKTYKEIKREPSVSLLLGQSGLDFDRRSYEVPATVANTDVVSNVLYSSNDLDFSEAITRNYNAIKALLKDARKEIIYFSLNALDLLTLDFTKPIWIGNDYQAYFFLSKIIQYTDTANSVRCEVYRLS